MLILFRWEAAKAIGGVMGQDLQKSSNVRIPNPRAVLSIIMKRAGTRHGEQLLDKSVLK
jgi:hypothetical protein